jgi:hypothetical protein
MLVVAEVNSLIVRVCQLFLSNLTYFVLLCMLLG